ncbi:hypothetical protein PHLGIDRAFT_450255 [Phlebiopsis gigantea 11061_1 CR5-6]|uniref:Ubiquitin-like domain-containing protein n=1 Tax=Phlebiopsis gigantea (strain 11061_1 CR5-6) TaxID=745531 RepID=A0A0C3NNI4_PHLG1|nr:hypothetical protein PHLGIDRAFT_450255 [Phlebiopsis gigantea 11061_1 CR5-6]
MSFALTFGGFGDFTTLIGLVTTTCKLIAECYQAAKEQQAVVFFLTKFREDLLIWKPVIDSLTMQNRSLLNPAQARALDAAINIILDAMTRCSRAIDDFQAKVVRNAVISDSCPRTIKIARVAGVKAKQRLYWVFHLKGEAKGLQNILKEQTQVLIAAATGIGLQLASSVHYFVASEFGTPTSGGIVFLDMLGMETLVPWSKCHTYKIFIQYLSAHYRGRAGEAYVQDKMYRLTYTPQQRTGTSEHTIQFSAWDVYLCQAGIVKMAAIHLRNSGSSRPGPASGGPTLTVTQECMQCGKEVQLALNRESECYYCRTKFTYERHLPGGEAESLLNSRPGALLNQSHDYNHVRRFHYYDIDSLDGAHSTQTTDLGGVDQRAKMVNVRKAAHAGIPYRTPGAGQDEHITVTIKAQRFII